MHLYLENPSYLLYSKIQDLSLAFWVSLLSSHTDAWWIVRHLLFLLSFPLAQQNLSHHHPISREKENKLGLYYDFVSNK